MSDEQAKEQVKQESVDVEALMEQLKARQEEVESMRNHQLKLLDETKKAKQKAAEEKERAQKEAERQVAKEKGDLEQLIKSYEEQLKEKEAKFEEYQKNINKEKINNKALEMASKVSSGGKAKLLAEKIADRLSFSEDEFRVTNEKGELTVDSPDKLLDTLKSNDDYKFLFDGTKASGGGAPGNSNSVAKSNIKTRSEFDSMDPVQRMEFIQAGGRVND